MAPTPRQRPPRHSHNLRDQTESPNMRGVAKLVLSCESILYPVSGFPTLCEICDLNIRDGSDGERGLWRTRDLRIFRVREQLGRRF